MTADPFLTRCTKRASQSFGPQVTVAIFTKGSPWFFLPLISNSKRLPGIAFLTQRSFLGEAKAREDPGDRLHAAGNGGVPQASLPVP